MYCHNCGTGLPEKSTFCTFCGTKVGAQPAGGAARTTTPLPPPPPTGDVAKKALQTKISWNIDVPIFRDPLILKQLGLAIGIPFGLLIVILTLISGVSIYTLYALGLIAALFFFTWLFIKLVHRGKYAAEFILNEKGALCRTQAKQAKTNRVVNSLAVLLGLLTGKLVAVGAGMLAQSKQQVFINWNRLTRVKYYPRSHTILLRGGLTENIALFCNRENYPVVEQFVRAKTMHLQTN